MLAAAIDLVLDENLLPTKACDQRKLPAGSHTRAKALAARIVAGGFLRMCNPDPAQEAQVLNNTGLSDTLLVQQGWLKRHDVTVGPLTFSPWWSRYP
jgi:hypothetical protein